MIWGVAIGSWTSLFTWSISPYSVYLGHGELGNVSTPAELFALASLFLLGWSLMVLAMMLPTTFPLVNEFRRRTAGLRVNGRWTMPLVAGCVCVWAPFGIIIYFMDLGVHRAVGLPPLQGNVWILGLSSLALAGSYQFTRAKYGYLKDCCYPSEFLQSHWQTDLTHGSAFRLGLSYGRISIGSHWALMLLMFSLGLGSIPLMLLLGPAMAVEHEPRLGPKMRLPIGVAILALTFYFGLANIRF